MAKYFNIKKPYFFNTRDWSCWLQQVSHTWIRKLTMYSRDISKGNIWRSRQKWSICLQGSKFFLTKRRLYKSIAHIRKIIFYLSRTGWSWCLMSRPVCLMNNHTIKLVFSIVHKLWTFRDVMLISRLAEYCLRICRST